jgi:glutathione S-transferase
LPRVERWFERVRARPTFHPSFVLWLPAELAAQMRANGERSWPAIAELLQIGR